MTSETKSNHTPAPWELRQSANGYWFIDHEQGGEGYTLTKLDCDEIDARLISAAPELLAALIELSNYVFDEYSASHPLCERAMEARELIKRVKGATG